MNFIGLGFDWNMETFPCGRFERGTRHAGKAMDQREREDSDSRHQTADGLESATTVDVSNSASTHGKESQNVALGSAGRCVHGANRNRVHEQKISGQPATWQPPV
jgi:hypothetical protein